MNSSAIPLQIRPCDCDSYGHVNNAVYVSYFQQALAECLANLGHGADWQRDGECWWGPQSLNLEYRRPALFGDKLQGCLWLAAPHRTHPDFGFEVYLQAETPEADAPTVFRAAGVWCRKQRNGGHAQEIADDTLAALPQAPGTLPRDFHPPAIPPDVRAYHWEHCVGIHEVGAAGHVHPQALYQWLEESIFDACEQAGWPLSRWLAAGIVTYQTRHDTEIHLLPTGDDVVRITSRLVEVRHLGGTWLQEVQRATDGRLFARDYSTGIHVNLEGRPASPPPQIIDDIQHG
jgi:acyl-CoA thioesterase FadM